MSLLYQKTVKRLRWSLTRFDACSHSSSELPPRHINRVIQGVHDLDIALGQGCRHIYSRQHQGIGGWLGGRQQRLRAAWGVLLQQLLLASRYLLLSQLPAQIQKVCVLLIQVLVGVARSAF